MIFLKTYYIEGFYEKNNKDVNDWFFIDPIILYISETP